VVSYAILFGVTRTVSRVSKFFVKEEINHYNVLERPLMPSPHVTAIPWEETERTDGMLRVPSGGGGMLRNSSFGEMSPELKMRKNTSFTDFTQPQQQHRSPHMSCTSQPFGTPQTLHSDLAPGHGGGELTKADFILCEGSDSGFSGATPDP